MNIILPVKKTSTKNSTQPTTSEQNESIVKIESIRKTTGQN